MNNLENLLSEVDRLDQEASEAPWQQDRNEYPTGDVYAEAGSERMQRKMERIDPDIRCDYAVDAEFIALARTSLPALSRAARAVLELHKPFTWSFSAGDQVYTITSCQECARLGADEEDAIYPCPTVQAITDALKGQDND